MPKLQTKVNQYSVYDRSSGTAKFLQDTKSYKRPSISFLSSTISGAGMSGEIDVPSPGQLSSMSIEIGLRNETKEILQACGSNFSLEIRWVVDNLDKSTGKITTKAYKDIVKGFVKSIDLGSVETNKENEVSITGEVTYFNHIIDGSSIIEIDKLNEIVIIDGTDLLEDVRENL